MPHDVAGLTSQMGGDKALENALDSLFAKNEYWHDNEPGHQIPFMYNYTAAPWKTQQVVRRILSEEYSDGAGGLSGNDDAGQMSAWYVFAAIGLYPVDPVSGEHLICSPIFDKITLQVPGSEFQFRRCRAEVYLLAACSLRLAACPFTGINNLLIQIPLFVPTFATII